MPKKVFVSGCFDLLHSGHVAFFQEAAAYGDLYVAVGSDQTVYDLKGRAPLNSQKERLFMVRSVGCVHEAFVSQGAGMLDFEGEFKAIQPDVFVVNEDGHTPDKAALCAAHGVEYVVLRRQPAEGLAPRSTTALRSVERVPFRIDLAGGWLDQPFVSQHYPGAVITLSIEPTVDFNDRSGMASSTRKAALDLWGPRLPVGDLEKLARVLFCYDNPPGTEYISGAQDSIGIIYPGLAYSYYEGGYWPTYIERYTEEGVLRFVEEHLYLVTLGPRGADFDVLAETRIDQAGAKALADATDAAWEAIQHCDTVAFGRAVRESFEAQIAMFPHMMTPQVAQLITQYQDRALGWKLSGAGGGGYLILVADAPIEHALRIVVRRADS